MGHGDNNIEEDNMVTMKDIPAEKEKEEEKSTAPDHD